LSLLPLLLAAADPAAAGGWVATNAVLGRHVALPVLADASFE
jgi:hypothetical protein